MIDIRESETGKLLMRYDPDQNVIEIQRRSVKTIIDLKQYQRSAMSDEPKLTPEQELKWIKRAIFMNFIDVKSPLAETDMTCSLCVKLIEDIGRDYASLLNYKRHTALYAP